MAMIKEPNRRTNAISTTSSFSNTSRWKRQLIVMLVVGLVVVVTITTSLRITTAIMSPSSFLYNDKETDSMRQVKRFSSSSRLSGSGVPGRSADQLESSSSALSSMMIVVDHRTSRAAPSSFFCREIGGRGEKCRHNYQYVALGVTKCGTASLKETASVHPRIRTHPEAESHFFDSQGKPRQPPKRKNITRSLESDFFRTLGGIDGNFPFYSREDDPNDGLVYGEHTPGYLWITDYNCKGTDGKNDLYCKGKDFVHNATSLIDRMASVLPRETLMIVTIRDPAKRAFSHFSHFGPRCPDEWYGKANRPKCFHEFVVKELQSIQTCFDMVGNRFDIRCILMPYDHDHRGTRLVSLGLYYIYLQHWLRHFPNFCLIDVTSHGGDRRGIARDLEDCLGLDHEPELNLTYTEISQSSRSEPMWEITKDMLDGFYAPYNRLLCQMAPHTCSWDWVQNALDRK